MSKPTHNFRVINGGVTTENNHVATADTASAIEFDTSTDLDFGLDTELDVELLAYATRALPHARISAIRERLLSDLPYRRSFLELRQTLRRDDQVSENIPVLESEEPSGAIELPRLVVDWGKSIIWFHHFDKQTGSLISTPVNDADHNSASRACVIERNCVHFSAGIGSDGSCLSLNVVSSPKLLASFDIIVEDDGGSFRSATSDENSSLTICSVGSVVAVHFIGNQRYRLGVLHVGRTINKNILTLSIPA